MNVNILIMVAILIILSLALLIKSGPEGLLDGLKAGTGTLRQSWILLLLALGIGGFLTVLIPTELVSEVAFLDGASRYGAASRNAAMRSAAVLRERPYAESHRRKPRFT